MTDRPAAAEGPARSLRLGLSGKLLVLTILFVMIAEVLIYVPSIANYRLNWLQDRLAAALEASGDGWLSTTTLRGRTYLRAGVVNYLTDEADIDRLLATLRSIAGETGPA